MPTLSLIQPISSQKKLMSSLGGGGGGIVCSGAPILKTSTGISGLCNKLLPLKLITVFNVMINFN